MNSILIIDDSTEFVTTFTNEARAKNIAVAAGKSLEALKKFLPIYEYKFAAVVLDIKCLLNDDQPKEDKAFITAALRYLDSTVPKFPRYILTGDDSEFDTLKNYYKDEKMFIKKPSDLEKLFLELNICIQNAVPLRIKRENVDIFDAFERGLLPSNKENTVINILKRYNETDYSAFKGIIGDVREIHEDIYKSTNKRNSAVIPSKYLNANGSPSFNGDFYKHLQGNPNYKHIITTKAYQDSTILSHTKFIHNTCSEFLHGSSKTGYKISAYTVKSLINSLMELIIWSKQY